jgi:sterol desaturase/sphingolipid hydroxylase (fatty acid hydroxylase superfamily)
MNETLLRVGVFACVFCALALAETMFPARERTASRARRWITNGALLFFSTVLVRVIAPLGVVGAALWADAQGIGIFNVVAAPFWIAAIMSLLVLDASLYLQHRLLHAVPLLWRMHAPHHADTDLDVSSGVRFHPLEMAFSVLWKGAIVIALGAPGIIVLAFEIALNAFSMFTHANLRLPAWLERSAGHVFITPTQHRMHHDCDVADAPPNFGFSITLWDRLARTWARGGAPRQLGLPAVSRTEAAQLAPMVFLPFRGPLP